MGLSLAWAQVRPRGELTRKAAAGVPLSALSPIGTHSRAGGCSPSRHFTCWPGKGPAIHQGGHPSCHEEQASPEETPATRNRLPGSVGGSLVLIIHHHPHFTEEETEAQGGWGTCPKAQP